MLSLLYSTIGTLFSLSFSDWVLALLLIDWYHFWFPFFTKSISCTLLFRILWLYLCVCKCVNMYHYFCNYLLDPVLTIYLGSSFISRHALHFCLGEFALTPFNPIIRYLWSPDLLTKDHTWTFEVGTLSPRSHTTRGLLSPGGINY